MCFLFVLFYVRACVRVSLFSYYFPLSRFIFLSFRSSDHSSAVFCFSFVYFYIFLLLYVSILFVGRTNATHAKTISRRSFSQMLNYVHACVYLCAHTMTMKSIHISRKRFDAIHFGCFVYALCSVPLLRSQFYFSTSYFVSNLLFVFSISHKTRKEH